jgi:hypothetical protein
MTPAVQAAVTEVEQSFPGHRIEVTPEDQGGAYVIVHDFTIGGRYVVNDLPCERLLPSNMDLAHFR